MQIILTSPTELEIDGKRYACRIGRAGVAADKREGDLMTPPGSFAMRCCYYRPDRLAKPETGLKTIALAPDGRALLARGDNWNGGNRDQKHGDAERKEAGTA